MDIKPTSNVLPPQATGASQLVTDKLAADAHANWQLANQVKAIVEKITASQLILNINGTRAITEKPAMLQIKPGDILALQVTQLKPQPTFKVIGLQQTASATAIQQLATALLSVKAALPVNENNLNNLFNNIAYVANRPSLQPAPLAPEVNAILKQVFNNLPAPHDLRSAQQVRMHIQNSGLFLESKLKNFIAQQEQQLGMKNLQSAVEKPVPQVNHDLRVQLHRLANILRSYTPTATQTGTGTSSSSTTSAQSATPNSLVQTYSPPQLQPGKAVTPTNHDASQARQSLSTISHRDEAIQTVLRQVESSLNQVQQNQLQSLNDSTPARPLWLMEIPIRNGQDIDLFELRIEQDEAGNNEDGESRIWRLTLKFDLEGLGQVTSFVTLKDETISALFTADKQATLGLFKSHFELLKSRLNTTGLAVGQLETGSQAGSSHD